MQSTDVRLNWRPISADDVSAWQALLAAAEAVDDTGEHYDVDDLLEELADPALDAERDTLAAFADEQMVAYGRCHGPLVVQGSVWFEAEGCVHPDHRRRGLGRQVLERTALRTVELHRQRHPESPAELHVESYDNNVGATALMRAAGLQPVRWWFDMRRDLDGPLPSPSLPENLRLVPFDSALDEAMRQARNEAFADHWGSVDRDESSWRQWYTGCRAFRPELSLLVMDGAEVAAFLLSHENVAEGAASGVREVWIPGIGTRPRWRGRGVATALLAAGLRTFADAGYQRASLGVDTANPTGALGIYQRLGFAPVKRRTTYVRPL